MSKQFDCFVSVIVPICNDSEILEAFLRETHRALTASFAHFELILVDDGSRDRTQDILGSLLKELHSIRVLGLLKSFGYEAAISAGLNTAIGDYIVLMDPHTDPPEQIVELVAKAQESNQVVFGVDAAPSQNVLQRLARWLFFRLAHFFLEAELVENATRFMAFNRQILNALTTIGIRQRYTRLLTTLIAGRGVTFPYQRRQGPSGDLRSLLEAGTWALSLLIQNSTRPLRLASTLGLLASGGNLLYMGYVAGVIAFNRHIAAGWVTLSLQNSTMFFTISLTLAVIAEYILRIMDESRNLPIYHLREETNSSVLIPAESRRNVVLESRSE